MQFKVPQDVQREDTIIGPLTLRQMIILGIGGGIAYSLYVTLAKTYFMEVWLPPVAIVTAITAAFAFLKIHNLPFHEFLMSFIEYHVLPKKRIWTQGGGQPYESELVKLTKKPEKAKETNKKKKDPKSIAELSRIVDSKKHEELEKIANQNFNQ